MTLNVLCNLFVSIIIDIVKIAFSFNCKHNRFEIRFLSTGIVGYIVTVMSRYSFDSRVDQCLWVIDQVLAHRKCLVS